MKRLLIWIIVLVSLCSIIYADQTCYISRECTFETVVLNNSNYYNGSVTNSLFKTNETYYLNQAMRQIVKDGSKISYIYNYTFNESGTYLRESVAGGVPITEQITVESFSIDENIGLTLFNQTLIYILIIVLFLGLLYFILRNK